MSLSSIFRSSKTRSSRSQNQLLSRSLKLKQDYYHDDSNRSIYQCTYDISMPLASVQILQPLMSGLVGGRPRVNADIRDTHTVGLWIAGSSGIYRCCFVQPEISTATASTLAHRYERAKLATHIVSENINGAAPSTVTCHRKRIQISGRLAPYVVAEMDVDCDWTFANIAKSRFIFICTDDNGSHIVGMTRRSLTILRAHKPHNIAIIDDVSTKAYKITARPVGHIQGDEPNKNTCMVVYPDGAFKVTGKPEGMKAIGEGFRTALHAVAMSRSWPLFVRSLEPL